MIGPISGNEIHLSSADVRWVVVTVLAFIVAGGALTAALMASAFYLAERIAG